MAPPPRPVRSVYRVAYVVGSSANGWTEAAAETIAELAKSITDLRIARVVEKDLVRHDDEALLYRVKLAVSFRLDREQVATPAGTVSVRRFLVVADQTVTGDALHRVLAERVKAGPCEFHLVVPVHLPRITNATLFADPMTGYSNPEVFAEAEAETIRDGLDRLDQALTRLRSAGAVASGEVAETDPVAAAAAVLDRGSFDEVIVCTMPRALSRWLRRDIPSRLERATRLPVTHVEEPA